MDGNSRGGNRWGTVDGKSEGKSEGNENIYIARSIYFTSFIGDCMHLEIQNLVRIITNCLYIRDK